MTPSLRPPPDMPPCLEGLPFVKMEGAGNDFVVLDGRFRDLTEVLTPAPLQWLADRQFGVGADQILVLDHQHGPEADFRYRIFNADGREVSQCGNGARCFARYVFERGLASGPTIRVLTASGVIVPRLLDSGEIEVDMGPPRFQPEDLPMDLAGLDPVRADSGLLQVSLPLEAGWPEAWSRPWSLVSMGNPHLVAWWDGLDEEALDQAIQTLGPWLQSHVRLPERVNVGFAQRLAGNAIRLRVYERGSGETLACGTGACAAAVAGIAAGLLDRAEPVAVQMRGGQLQIRWTSGSQEPSTVWLGGPARTVFEGRLSAPQIAQKTHRQVQAAELRALLADYPQVFMEHPDLLAGLDLRHPHTGTVISLLERQTQVLRDQLRQQQSRLGLLLGHAQENDIIQSRLFAWVRSILLVPADARASTLRESLAAIFQLPVVELCRWPVDLNGDDLADIPPAEAVLRSFLNGLSRPACVSSLSEPGRAALACLRDQAVAQDLAHGSLAILPLRRGLRPVVEGALILATPDSGRFGPDHGLVYLEQIAELASAAVLPGQGLLELAIDPDATPTFHA